ncbi:tRNA A37 threonylcarbamoyladenosine synthetase subunit TsaC/SUA5/YrdC [Streptomyces sp. SAI-135]|jgi:tRNA A37 threonylcarbamoyladenosine synthetase subunit TsaC/SUA5/YrdC|uniref:L-threonylcarbamoyladenylate synthase n=1 Tax=unclassified Streptomyces TaxID=2593676 RepID=UPI0024750D70|nr:MULTISPECIES: Sua5/YciO/YrdC/YwlC family protein [unclassified Streptomyces]MDH6522887.1 tRNA A37 threonylcarbamoyladenosine synthetase subunit TsaC/SUA5/YrdC [Streptomyces sp. SAI-090]MDH6554508.1 tRNA A37 threonylcarbamoyladenosine synthetase subunit TsaC/SUA5/YrdC [Streptomyces sp. SAI-041]MDH6581495.1 tRNA A37 threonylcarbamoyladenosine synthetase subunit TsaC/SUA5/YrdC [Streptomyces sp. SAI-133]MDH6613499.1 tRNA A37 threonylcarbamoyladenosine synthetase subunit TsaC/SUA5/YrdC [Streptomy
MGRHDINADAKRVFDTITAGGAVILPGDIGYGAGASSPEALQRLFVAKRRAPHKRHAMVGNYELHREVHELGSREQEIVDAITIDADLPLTVVAAYRADHPVVAAVEADTLAASTVGNTLALLVNGGRLQDEVVRLCHQAGLPFLGSSANLTGTGTKFRVEDIQQPIIDAVDLVIDYGLRKYHHYRRSSTIIDFSTMEVVRIGTCYELISDIMATQFGITLPADPGRDALPSGHLREQAQ